jgi:hypothetical protein
LVPVIKQDEEILTEINRKMKALRFSINDHGTMKCSHALNQNPEESVSNTHPTIMYT